MFSRYSNLFDDCPIIAAVKDEAGLESCLQSESRIVFVLFGNLCNIEEIVKRIKQADKTAIVHIDLITGLAAKEVAVDYISRHTEADGIISTKPALIKRAQELSLIAIQRFFLIDSIAFENIIKQMETCRPDFVEVLPGTMPKIIRRLCTMISAPVIAGGLITDKEDIIAALNSGAVAISTTNQSVWFM
ncbi:glycerol-3-phosphate responsive antiterminator [Acetanaerobacterium elongatum]|uniref:Intein N-terminal splicing region n=1 Tax=Acetanaerobacterium elongatum TaxID=258515 RepID=A0A1H0FKK6_9FIRM|nr:glycerol-3-phosphate responsive antiterminator [Acetanaerobacterium elongatum]SDN95167.1 intein N-terminal splicing region [Acetanaerobacterium elongatum]